MFTGAYSSKFKEVYSEELEQQRQDYQQQISYRRERAKQLSEETNRRRRALEEKKRLQALEEEKRREETLAKRRKTQEQATKKYQRETIKARRNSQQSACQGSEYGTPTTVPVAGPVYREPSEKYNYYHPCDTLQHALELVQGVPSHRQTLEQPSDLSGLAPTYYNTWVASDMRPYEPEDETQVNMNGTDPTGEVSGNGTHEEQYEMGGYLPEPSSEENVYYEQEKLREKLMHKSKLDHLQGNGNQSERTEGALPLTMEYESPPGSVSTSDSLEDTKTIEVVSDGLMTTQGILSSKDKSTGRHNRKVTFNDSIEFNDGLTGQLEILEKNSNKMFGLGNPYNLQFYSAGTGSISISSPVAAATAQATQPQVVSNYIVNNMSGRLSSSGTLPSRTSQSVITPKSTPSLTNPSMSKSGSAISLSGKTAPMHTKDVHKAIAPSIVPARKLPQPVSTTETTLEHEPVKVVTEQSPSQLVNVKDSLEFIKGRNLPVAAATEENIPDSSFGKEETQFAAFDLNGNPQEPSDFTVKVSNTLKWILDQNNRGTQPPQCGTQQPMHGVQLQQHGVQLQQNGSQLQQNGSQLQQHGAQIPQHGVQLEQRVVQQTSPEQVKANQYQNGFLDDSLNEETFVDYQKVNPTVGQNNQPRGCMAPCAEQQDNECENTVDVVDSLDMRDSLEAKAVEGPSDGMPGGPVVQPLGIDYNPLMPSSVNNPYASGVYGTQQPPYSYRSYIYEQQLKSNYPQIPSYRSAEAVEHAQDRAYATMGAVTSYQSTAQTSFPPSVYVQPQVISKPFEAKAATTERVDATVDSYGRQVARQPVSQYIENGVLAHVPPGTYVPPSKPGYYAMNIPATDNPSPGKPPMKNSKPHSNGPKPAPRAALQKTKMSKANANGGGKKTEMKGEFGKRNAANKAKSSSMNDLSRLDAQKDVKGFSKSKESPRSFAPVSQKPKSGYGMKKPRAKSAPSNRPPSGTTNRKPRPESAISGTSTLGVKHTRSNSTSLIVGNKTDISNHQRSNSVQYTVEAVPGGTITKPVILTNQGLQQKAKNPGKGGNLKVTTFTTDIQEGGSKDKTNGVSILKQPAFEENSEYGKKLAMKKNVSAKDIRDVLNENGQQKKKAVTFDEQENENSDEDGFMTNIKQSMDQLTFYSKYKKDKPKITDKIEPVNEFDAGTFTVTSYFQPNTTDQDASADTTATNNSAKSSPARTLTMNMSRKVHRPASPPIAYRNNLANRIANRKADQTKQSNLNKLATNSGSTVEAQDNSPPKSHTNKIIHNNIALDRTPTDDEINRLWEKVRTCLDHKDQPQTAGSDSCINTVSHSRTFSAHVPQQPGVSEHASTTSGVKQGGSGYPLRRYGSYEGLRRGGSYDSINTRKSGALLQSRALRSSSASSSSQGKPPLPRNKHHNPSPGGEGPVPSMSVYHRKSKLSSAEMKAVMAASERMKYEHGQPIQHYYLPSHLERKGPSALSMEEQRLMESLDRLNERLRAQEVKQPKTNGTPREPVKVSHKPPAGFHHTRSASARGYQQSGFYGNQYYSPAPPHR